MVAFLFGENVHHREDLLPVLKRLHHDVHITKSFDEVWGQLKKRKPVIFFISSINNELLNFFHKVHASEFSNCLTTVAYMDHVTNRTVLKSADAGLDELIIKPDDKKELEAQIVFVSKHALEKYQNRDEVDTFWDPDILQYLIALKNSRVMLFIQDNELRYQWIYNPHPGFEKEKVLNKTDSDLFPEKQAQLLNKLKKDAISRGQPIQSMLWMTRDDHESFYDLRIMPNFNSMHDVRGITVSAVDITDIKKRERALKESENRFHCSFNNAPIGMAIISTGGNLMEVNKALCDLLGYSDDELLTMTFKDLSHPKDANVEMDYVRSMLRGEISNYQVEKRYVHKSGKIIQTILNSSVVRNEHGSVRYFIGQLLDITERKEVEEQLKRSESRFSKAFHKAPTPIVISRMRDGYIYDVNNSFLKFSGFTREEVVGDSAINLKFWDNRSKRRDLIKEIDNHSFLQNYQMDFRIKSGDYRDTLLSVEQIELEGEKCLLTMISDVTERNRAEQKLRHSEARNRSILEATVDAIITFDGKGKIESFNKAASSMFGYTHGELMGDKINSLLPQVTKITGIDFEQFRKTNGLEPAEGNVIEMNGQRKDGTVFPLDLTLSNVKLQGRNIYTAVIRDIRERRALEQEILIISEQERRRIGQDLHDGLGQMLSGISLISQSLVRKLKANALPGADDVEEISELIREADNYARNLARGLVPVELEANGITTALKKLTLNAQRLFGITCEFNVHGDIQIIKEFISLHLYRIAQEAISNAVRHGKANKVIVSLSEEEEKYVLKIEDNGTGFKGKRDDGQGMGLRIMQYRARMINGSLFIKSKPEKLTQIICYIPKNVDISSEK